MSGPPSHWPAGMKIDSVVAHLKAREIIVSRRTVYNWLKTGVAGVRLQHGTVPNVRPTAKDRTVIVVTVAQLEDFLAAAGVEVSMT